MDEILCTTPIPQTPRELDDAVERYQASDAQGDELYCQWYAIREAALEQRLIEPDRYPVQGTDSY